jgi:hypothetical protein
MLDCENLLRAKLTQESNIIFGERTCVFGSKASQQDENQVL